MVRQEQAVAYDTSLPGTLRIDQHVIQPEIERKEMIGGKIRPMSPAEYPHATLNSDLDYLLRAHVAPGYRVATDLLTRHDEHNDFASDCAVIREGVDPATGTRFCEELAFEIVSTQSLASVSRKAPVMIRRGVERVFALLVKKGQLIEWISDPDLPEQGRWQPLDGNDRIEHPSLAEPLTVAALLDAASADDTVARALSAKGNAVIEDLKAESKADGRLEGKAEGMSQAILTVLTGRGLVVDEESRAEILRCKDVDTLDAWLLKAGVVSSAEEMLG